MCVCGGDGWAFLFRSQIVCPRGVSYCWPFRVPFQLVYLARASLPDKLLGSCSRRRLISRNTKRAFVVAGKRGHSPRIYNMVGKSITKLTKAPQLRPDADCRSPF